MRKSVAIRRAWRVGLFLLFAGSSLFAANLPVGSIQRFRVVGSSEDGKRVAMLLSHFGPSSQAPFVNLLVKEAGKHEPLWQDNRFLMEGGEEELRYLEGYLLKGNQAKLAEFGIKTDKHAHDVTAQWSTSGARSGKLATGAIDVKNKAFVSFSLGEDEVPGCAEGLKGKRWKLCVGDDACVVAKSGDDCYTNEFTLRTIVRTKDTHWFIVNRKMPVFDALNAYVVDFVGVEIKPKK